MSVFRQGGRLLAVAVAMQVAGCSGEAPDPALYDHRFAHPLSAQAEAAVLVLELPPTGRLSASDAARMEAFAADYVKRGEGALDLMVAASSDAAVPSATAAGKTIIRQLAAAGVAADSIAARVVVRSDTIAPGTAMLQYRQWAAVVPECGNWSQNTVIDPHNANSPNFGCSTQRNIGMMMVNPRDLVRPADSEPRLGDVGDRVISRYRRGEETKTYTIEFQSLDLQR